MAKVLIIEDDKALVKMVGDWLRFEKNLVETAFTGREGLEKLQCFEFDIIILDWELPEMSGVEILKEFRRKGKDTPILMLTGKKTISDKEAGFGAGADDYLTKPFDMKELSLRIKALLRRAGAISTDVIEFKNLKLEVSRHKLLKDGKEVRLNPKEFSLLEFLMRHRGDVFSADALLSRVWASEADSSIDAVTTCIKRIRKKLDEKDKPSIIRTVHGVGYSLDDSQI